jgi:hypothetical protein
MRRIFISHSAKSDTDRTYLNAIYDGLKDAGFRVWQDGRELNAGDDWNQRICNILVYCQGAVVLVSEESLRSPFVRFEISNLLLRWRRERDQHTQAVLFPLCPVLLSETVDLRSGFAGAIGFADDQFLGPCEPAKAVERLKEQFNTLPDFADRNNPLAYLETQIAGILAKVRPEALQTAATRAAFPEPPERADAAAVYLARVLLLKPLGDVYNLLIAIQDLSKEQRQTLFELIAPGWVSLEAAQTLRDAYSKKPPLGCALKARIADFTPAMYLRRARMLGPKSAGTVAQVTEPIAGHAREQLLRLVRRALGYKFGIPMDATDPGFDEALRDQLQTARDLSEPIVVAIRVSEMDVSLVSRLRGEDLFAGVTFLALCTDAERHESNDELSWLDPGPDEDQERRAHRLYGGVIDRLRS